MEAGDIPEAAYPGGVNYVLNEVEISSYTGMNDGNDENDHSEVRIFKQ